MNNKQILTAIENYPADLLESIYAICDIYCIDFLDAYDIIQNEYGPLHNNTPLLK